MKPRLTDKVLEGLNHATYFVIQDIEARSGDDDPMYSKRDVDIAYTARDWVSGMQRARAAAKKGRPAK